LRLQVCQEQQNLTWQVIYRGSLGFKEVSKRNICTIEQNYIYLNTIYIYVYRKRSLF